MPKPKEEEVVELLTWDPSDGTDEDEEAFDDELPADENFAGDDDELVEEDAPEVAADGYSAEKKTELPQPDRAKSHPDLPRVKSNAFKRILR